MYPCIIAQYTVFVFYLPSWGLKTGFRKRDVQVRLPRPNGVIVVGLKAGAIDGTAIVETGTDRQAGSKREVWLSGTSKYRPRGCAKEIPGMLPKSSVFSRFLHFALRFWNQTFQKKKSFGEIIMIHHSSSPLKSTEESGKWKYIMLHGRLSSTCQCSLLKVRQVIVPFMKALSLLKSHELYFKVRPPSYSSMLWQWTNEHCICIIFTYPLV